MTRHIDHLIIHSSASRAKQNFTSTDIDRWHRANGWFGCGYHFVIPRDGNLESHELGDRCRPLSKVGAHVGDCGAGWNKRSLGICLIGGLDEEGKAEDNYTEAQYKCLDSLLSYLLLEYPDSAVMGHRDLIKLTKAPPKDCPCFDVRKWCKEKGIN